MVDSVESTTGSSWRKLVERIRELVVRTPVDVEAVARSLGVVEIEPRALTFDGYLARRADGKLAIRYNETSSPERVRFTIAHEVGHILIAQEMGRSLDSPVTRAEFRDDAEEQLANRLAAELLIPSAAIGRFLTDRPVNWATIDLAGQAFQASVTSLLLRLKELQQVSYFEIGADNCAPDSTRVLALGFGRLSFCRKPKDELHRLVREADERPRSLHRIRLWIGDRILERPLVGRMVRIRGVRVSRFITWSPTCGSSPCTSRDFTGTFLAGR